MIKPLFTMRHALSDPNLFGTLLVSDSLTEDSWAPWRVLLIGIMGEPLTDDEIDIWCELTGGRETLSKPADEFWAVVGRRAGKTKALSILAAYLAGLCSWDHVLTVGEVGVLPFFAASQEQAKVAYDYTAAIFAEVPILRQMVKGDPLRMTLNLTNGVSLQVRSSNFKTLRGRTFIAAIIDEVAFLETSEYSSNPDTEILNAIRPALTTTGGMVIAMSNPHGKSGELHTIWDNHFGGSDDPGMVVVQAPSLRMHNSEKVRIRRARAMTADPASARAEYDAMFRDDTGAFLSRDAIMASVGDATLILPEPGIRYYCFVDGAGGSGKDSMTMAISFYKDGKAHLARIEERKSPFKPSVVVREFSEIAQSYRVPNLIGDNWGSGFLQEPFQQYGLPYIVSPRNKSEIYAYFISRFNSGQVRLLRNDKMIDQFATLERRPTSGGREIIDHRKRDHDDLANAAAGAIVLALEVPDVPGWAIMNGDILEGHMNGKAIYEDFGERRAKENPALDAYKDLSKKFH